MSTPEDQMPTNFGVNYVFWVICRWIYFNPLTILNCMQLIAIQLMVDYPTWRWLGTAASIIGIVIGQIRNKDKNYTVPIAQTNRDQAVKTILSTNNPTQSSPKE